MPKEFSPGHIIDALGGTNEVARLCEVRPPSVSDWRRLGIPRARLMFLKLAKPEVFAALETNVDNKVSSAIPCEQVSH